MQETPPVIRRNTRRERLIQTFILLCSMLLIGIVAKRENEKQMAVEETAMVQESNTTNVKLLVGVSDNLMMNEPKSVGLEVGVSKELEQFLRNTLPEVEKLEVDTVTSPAEVEPKKDYKSLDEVKISRDMDLTQTTGLSREDFCKLLADFKFDYAGFYEENAGQIWDLSQKYQVNEIFICGVFALESYYGSDDRHIAANNFGSIMTGDGQMVRYSSVKDGIEANYKLFANCYLSPDGKYYKGVTLDSIGDTYCPPTPDCPSWADKVYTCMQYFLEK